METKIFCPNCHQQECYVESENNVDSYLCVGCGYTTNSLYVEGSDILNEMEDTTPILIRNSKFVDPQTKLVWYPSVLNFPSKGMIFPDGTNEENWVWRAAPTIAVSEKEKENYPVPGKPGEFYSSRLCMEESKFYERYDFKNACKYIGILND